MKTHKLTKASIPTITFENLPPDNKGYVLARAIMGLRAAGLDVQFQNFNVVKESYINTKIQEVNKGGTNTEFFEPILIKL